MGRVSGNTKKFINPDIFRAYDIRGLYPSEIDERAVFNIGQALAPFFGRGKVVIARDGRISSPRLYRALCRGLKKSNLIKLGLATTPMFYYLVERLGARGGLMVTASHNPKEWNGLKVVGRNSEMISGYAIRKIIF
ncbi:MAG: hypothetical protein AAB617_02150 [Patescibacteria group bacterium]